MTIAGRLADVVMDHSKIAIVLMVLLTVAVGAGAPMVEQSSSLDQFQSDSPAGEKLDFIEANFAGQDGKTTTAQLIVRDGNVLSKSAMLDVLAFERALRASPTINDTLAQDNPLVGIPNVVATAAIRQDQARDLQERAAALQANRSRLEAESSALRNRSDALNETAARLQAALTQLRQQPDAPVEPVFRAVDRNSSVDLGQPHLETFRRAVEQLRAARSEEEAEAAYTLGTQGVLKAEYEALDRRASELEAWGQALQDGAETLESDRQALQNAPAPTLAEQREQLESMNESRIEDLVTTLLSDGGSGGLGGAGGNLFTLMPGDYEPGTAQAGATMLVVTQSTETEVSSPVGVSQRIVDAQLAMQEVADARAGSLDYLVFGGGIITHEVDASMADSMTIIGPLALLFVLLALAIGYRDVLDIVLGLFGIGAVLAWTFGFMGWADIAFNQLFVAVPVLLIGLSIDYAIHIFMRHREERVGNGTGGSALGDAEEDSGSLLGDRDGPRGSMRVALSGVGVALVWVTATTVIGFLSNLTSPVPPIREFGIVSSVGIVAALLVFGILVPALKVELDELLEGWGFDRRKRALGTGGGRASTVLSVGAVAARKGPYVVLVLALLVTVAGGLGGSQVSTAFDQADFLAEDPPDWMKELPEPFKPGDYTAKENLAYVNDNFLREDSKAELLVEGDLARPDTLERLADAEARAAEKPVTKTLSDGQPAIQSPLSVMESVAASNETFNSTFLAADTDGNGVPDRNLTGVYATLFEVAPDRAGSYIVRDGDRYTATRLVVGVEGGAPGAAITEQMQAVAGSLAGDGLTVTATGQPILNKIVQDQLLETVVQSLLITIVAVFVFLMLTYRLTEGSATLGAVTLMPVVLSVAWILGTMYLLGIPFNVLTGMITSLTVGLGVAYSIHLSERYNQELERQGDVWAAMRTAVTGTGGALVGSAATTVGGFGVLVFAILPPLQQFGLITGLTIIYALLGSVLVLPSLLVIWTRFVGPAPAKAQVKNRGAAPTEPGPEGVPDDGVHGDGVPDDLTPGDASPGETAAGTGATGPEEAATRQSGTGPTSAANGGAALANGATDAATPGGLPPAVPEAADSLGPVRAVDHTRVLPGRPVGVGVAADERGGRLVLRESISTGTLAVVDVSPEPVDVVERARELVVTWDLAEVSDVRVAYRVDVPAAAADGDVIEFDGTLDTGAREEPVDGTTRVEVATDLPRRLRAAGAVTASDLRSAAAHYRAGVLDEATFDAIHEACLEDASLAAVEGEGGTD